MQNRYRQKHQEWRERLVYLDEQWIRCSKKEGVLAGLNNWVDGTAPRFFGTDGYCIDKTWSYSQLIRAADKANENRISFLNNQALEKSRKNKCKIILIMGSHNYSPHWIRQRGNNNADLKKKSDVLGVWDNGTVVKPLPENEDFVSIFLNTARMKKFIKESDGIYYPKDINNLNSLVSDENSRKSLSLSSDDVEMKQAASLSPTDEIKQADPSSLPLPTLRSPIPPLSQQALVEYVFFAVAPQLQLQFFNRNRSATINQPQPSQRGLFGPPKALQPSAFVVSPNSAFSKWNKR